MTSYRIAGGAPRPSMTLAIELATRSAACEFFRLVSSSPQEATWETRRAGSTEVHRFTYTAAEAEASGGLGPIARKHIEHWLRLAAGYRLAMAVYRPEVEIALQEAP